jgi:hypothetical protein
VKWKIENGELKNLTASERPVSVWAGIEKIENS